MYDPPDPEYVAELAAEFEECSVTDLCPWYDGLPFYAGGWRRGTCDGMGLPGCSIAKRIRKSLEDPVK